MTHPVWLAIGYMIRNSEPLKHDTIGKSVLEAAVSALQASCVLLYTVLLLLSYFA